MATHDNGRGYRTHGGEQPVASGTTATDTRSPGQQSWSPAPRPWKPERAAPSGPSSPGWGLGGPEMKRRRRVAKYKAYCVEGRVKATLRKGVRWVKVNCSRLVHGY